MVHDEPSHRDGQDPNAYAPETESHYGLQIARYEKLLEDVQRAERIPANAIAHIEGEVARYRGYLENVLERKRTEGLPIAFDYAKLDDAVYFDEVVPYTLNSGKPYTKRQMLEACSGDAVAAKRLTEACVRRGAEKMFGKVIGCYESFVYVESADELRKAYGADTLYNRVTLVHVVESGAAQHVDTKLTEIVFETGLDHVVGDVDPIGDFDAWDERFDELREAFQDFSNEVLGVPAVLVIISPAKNWVREFESAEGDSPCFQLQSARFRTDLARPSLTEDALQGALTDALEGLRARVRVQP